MITFNKQKFLIALACTLIGWGVGYLMGKRNAERYYSRHHRNMDISRFFGFTIPEDSNPEEPPSRLEKLLKKWGFNSNEDDDDSIDSDEDSFFDKPFSTFGLKNAQPKISTREDDSFVYMEIDLDSFDKNSLSAKVENDSVVIEGNQKSEEAGSSMSSHFYQSFPTPPDTDSSKVDMLHENNKLVLKFPKIKR